ncbi:MAG: DUF427 domain-containing protein [Ilumatobacter sp.]|nr:DUF427 domain-containing protein [Ilumatobacter sp.]
MTLTLSNGPLAAAAPDTVNYEITGPQHKLLFSPFPRRVRAKFGGETVVDTDHGMLLHESNILPVLYVPVADVRSELLTKTDHTTHCPFKGDASYWSIAAGGRTTDNSVWGYETPTDDAAWLKGHMAFYWDHLDQWFDEDDEVFGHLRDPYHRVDARPTGRHVRVSVADLVVADTRAAMVVSETGLPNRYYIPAADVVTDQFRPSDTTTHCPYKGDTTYWTFVGDEPVEDVAWSYPTPLVDAARIAGHWSFDGDGVTVDVS